MTALPTTAVLCNHHPFAVYLWASTRQMYHFVQKHSWRDQQTLNSLMWRSESFAVKSSFTLFFSPQNHWMISDENDDMKLLESNFDSSTNLHCGVNDWCTLWHEGNEYEDDWGGPRSYFGSQTTVHNFWRAYFFFFPFTDGSAALPLFP